MIPNKVCPVVFRTHGAATEILAFVHPEAGCQLVKGTIEPNESIEVAALRELEEESGVTSARIVRHLGLWVTGYEEQVWAFVECSSTSALRDSWSHYVRDDGGHIFKFFWHPLGQRPDTRWHRVFREALTFVEGAA